jgi:hypothetical protein
MKKKTDFYKMILRITKNIQDLNPFTDIVFDIAVTPGGQFFKIEKYRQIGLHDPVKGFKAFKLTVVLMKNTLQN